MKNKKVLSFSVLIVAYILLIIYVPSLSLVAGMVSVGAVIQSGILGGGSGKVGPVVMGSWKGIDYIRSHVIPANPQSTNQTIQRTKFAAAVSYARSFLSLYINTYVSPFVSGLSGYNAWMQWNLPLLSASTNYINANCIMTKGTLVGVSGLHALYNPTSGNLTVTWTNNSGVGNALGTDTLMYVIANKDCSYVYQTIDSGQVREDATAEFVFETGKTPADFFVFAFFKRGTGSNLIVSDSSAVVFSLT